MFWFITLSLEILNKRKLYACKFCEIGSHPWKKSKMKTYCMEIQRIFLINPGIMKISLFFQLTPGISIDIFSVSITIQWLPYIYVPISIIYIYLNFGKQQILSNCMIQNISLRCHRNSVKNDTDDAELSENDCNTVILWHRVEGGDRNLDNHVQNGP